MAITTYGELKTAVANWLKRDDLVNRIPEFIAMGEDRVYNTLRIRELEATADISLSTAGGASYTLPTGWVAGRRIYISGSPNKVIEYRPPVNFWSIYSSNTSAQPVVYTIEGENIVFAPTPDAAYTAKVLYYQRLTAFSADADTNGLLTKARGVYLYASLLEAAPFLGDDPRILIWSQFWDDIVERLETADRKDRFSGFPLTQRDIVKVT